MPGQPIRLGPFTGGLNTLSDPASCSDVELVDCINFELDLDGSLVSRPPIISANIGPDSTRVLVIAYAILPVGTFLIGSANGKTYYFASGVWTLLTSTFEAIAAVQYANKIWLVAPPSSANPGGSWDGASFSPIASMPRGNAAVVHKDRMYIVPGENATTNTSRLNYSGFTGIVPDFTVWNAADFIDVNPGDGESAIDVVVYSDSITIFKQRSTWVLSFDTTPAQATLRNISKVIGVATKRCVVLYENSLYVFYKGNVYEIINYDFNRLNTKVPFLLDQTAPSTYTESTFLTLLGDRLIVRYYNLVYVFGLRTRTWTRWSSSIYFGPLVQVPSNAVGALNTKYYAGACVISTSNLYELNDAFDLTHSESMVCSIQTKNYDFSVSHKFKRLFWWGADVNASSNVIGSAYPVIVNFQTTWNDLATKTWSGLGTWNAPLAAPAVVQTSLTNTSGVMRRFAKFLKGLRFRQINFNVSITTTGTSSDGPARLFSLTAIVDTKETVVAGIS